MTAKPLVVIGAGGHAREIIEAVSAATGWRLLGVLSDDNEHPDRLSALGARYLGAVSAIADIEAMYVVGIGNPAIRRRISELADGSGHQAATIIHPAAVVGASVVTGKGCYVAARAVLTAFVTLGAHAHVNVAASISHDSVVGPFASIGPGAHLAGWVSIGDEADLGIGTNVLPRRRIGSRTVVGAGSTVTCDIPQDVTVVGTPARILTNRDSPEDS